MNSNTPQNETYQNLVKSLRISVKDVVPIKRADAMSRGLTHTVSAKSIILDETWGWWRASWLHIHWQVLFEFQQQRTCRTCHPRGRLLTCVLVALSLKWLLNWKHFFNWMLLLVDCWINVRFQCRITITFLVWFCKSNKRWNSNVF